MTLPLLRYLKRERIDLHLHSHHSCGRSSPQELADSAQKRGLSAMALADHHTVAGVPELMAAAAPLGIYVIPAVELHSREGDFLGFFIDFQNKQLLSFLEKARQMHLARLRAILDRLTQFGFPLSLEGLMVIAHPGIPNRATIAQVLVEQGHFADQHAVFSYMLGPTCPAFVPPIVPDGEACIRAIYEAGGVTVEAHPHITHANDDPGRIDKFYKKVVNLGLVGYETPPMDVHQSLQLGDRIRHIGDYFGLIGIEGSGSHDVHAGAPSRSHLSTGGDILHKLSQALPEHCVHRNLFDRLKWNMENLSPPGFLSSLFADEITLRRLHRAELLDRIAPPPVALPPTGGCPFLMIEPGAMEAESQLIELLKRAGIKLLAAETVEDYPALAWDLNGMHATPPEEKSRAILRFSLDSHLHGDKADQARILFFEAPRGIDLTSLRLHLHRELPVSKCYRSFFRGIGEMLTSSSFHLPGLTRIPRECALLDHHGIPLPQATPAPAMIPDA